MAGELLLGSEAEAERAAAVRDARAGAVDDAVRRLEQLLETHPGDRRVRLDLAVVAGWAGDDARTIALLEALDPGEVPEYALAAWAKAARNLKRWETALSLYDRLAGRNPASVEYALARPLVLADAGRFPEARAGLQRLREALPAESQDLAGVHFACGYLEERARRYTLALGCYQRALALAPGHTEARRRLILTAQALGAVGPALRKARDAPGLLTPEQHERLELDAAAMAVRRAALPAADSGRAVATALSAQEALLRRPGLDDPASGSGRTLRCDRVAALAAAGRAAEAIALFESLEAPPATPLPDYVLAAAASAYLELRQPARAAELFQGALDQAPERFDWQQGLFYAYSDLNDHERAGALAARMLAAEPAWLQPRPGRWLGNGRYARARELAALELAFRDRYDASLSQLDVMLAAAPANTALRLSRARVLRWGGWTKAATRDVERVIAQEPDNLGARLLAAELALDTRRFRNAQAALTAAAREAPEARSVLEVAGRWRLYSRPEIRLEAAAGRSDGGAFSSRDWGVEGYYYTAPIAYRYRAFVHDSAAYGRFDEGSGRDHRLGAGVEYRAPGWGWQAEINRGLEDNRASGAVLRGDWLVSDRLALEAAAEANSREVPLRATRIGVRGDAISLGGRYRWREGRAAEVAAGALHMDDGNERRWLRLAVEERLLNLPRRKLSATVTAYGSRNGDHPRVYYNPAADAELTVGLAHEWRLFRRYDRGLVQRIGVEAGGYWQQSFGSGDIWTLHAEHDWQIGPRTHVRYGVNTGGRVYDGNREHLAGAFVALEWRP